MRTERSLDAAAPSRRGWPEIAVGLAWFPVQILLGTWLAAAVALGIVTGHAPSLGFDGSARTGWGIAALAGGIFTAWGGVRCLRIWSGFLLDRVRTTSDE
jgi:hypothetical protein